MVIGHELTHGFDDEGKKFDAKGNLSDWWTPEDTKKFQAKTDCLVKEYGDFTAVHDATGDVKINGKLTLGENTADNGGLVLAYMAYLERAKVNGVDLSAKKEGYTPPQRFYIGYAQNWCENARPGTDSQPGTDQRALPGPLPCQWSDCEPARICGRIRMQEGIADGSGQQLQSVVRIVLKPLCSEAEDKTRK